MTAHGLCLGLAFLLTVCAASADQARPWIEVRGVYGGYPVELMEGGRPLAESGLNAVFVGSWGITDEMVETFHRQGARVFAEFNTMHEASYLKDHPDAAPIGSDGQVCPPPNGWQGICPTHEGYRSWRMDEFRKVLAEHPVDGVWLDYHHAHADWENDDPQLPDTCFCDRCVERFSAETGIAVPDCTRPEQAYLLLTTYRDAWVKWRCGVFTDWVREFRKILDATRPGALLGTYHCPWRDTDRGGALKAKLAIDLRAQAQYLDVFSIMPYHARFGHSNDPGWISRQIRWLGRYLGIRGEPGERHRIWPIVQLSDWGEAVPASQIPDVLDHGSRRPATGVMGFAWAALKDDPDKVTAIVRFYRAIAPDDTCR